MSQEKVGINQYLKNNLEFAVFEENRLHISPNIDSKKLAAAIKAFDFSGDETSIIALIDTSAFGSGKNGFIFTGERLLFKEILEKPISIRYAEIKEAKFKVVEKTNKKGKVSRENTMIIEAEGLGTRTFKYLSEVNLEKLVEILSSLNESFDEFSESSQLQPIEELSDELKSAYLQVIINMTFQNGGKVDEEEFSEILQLMSRLKVNPSDRAKLRHYIVDPSLHVNNSELISVINSHAPDGMRHSIHISLVKDLISVHSAVSGKIEADFDFLRQIRGELEIGDAEVDLAVEAIKNDKKILDRSYTDNAIQKSVKELSAKAVAVGVPLGAVYLSGSVVGMSAAGMTSGLASLGFGGVLGLSSMATGIGAAIMPGVVAYKGVQFLSNTGIEEGDKRRESMLQEVIRQSQKTMQIIIEDINELVKQLNSALNSQEIQSEKIQEMQRMFQLLSGSATQVSNKTQQAEVDKQRLNSPEVLDLQRLDACTRSSENKKYKEFILGFYEEGFIIDRNKGDEEVKKPVLRLTRLSSDEEMQKLGEIFEMIGYDSASSALRGKLRGVIS